MQSRARLASERYLPIVRRRLELLGFLGLLTPPLGLVLAAFFERVRLVIEQRRVVGKRSLAPAGVLRPAPVAPRRFPIVLGSVFGRGEPVVDELIALALDIAARHSEVSKRPLAPRVGENPTRLPTSGFGKPVVEAKGPLPLTLPLPNL